jgi:hypothetical protein
VRALRLFGARQVGAITVVDTPLSQSYARKALVAFLVFGVGVGVLTAAGAASVLHPALAVGLGLVVGAVVGFVVAVLVRVWPVLRVLWWWSAEIVALMVGVLVPAWLARLTHPAAALVVVVAVAALCAGVGPVRRRLVAWSWCVVVRHRLRLCFADFVRFAGRTRPGRLPLVLVARPTPAGARVWLWLRPGLDLTDLDGKADKVAVSCWASEARMVRASARFAALIRVDLTRRDALMGKVASPLAALVANLRKNEDEQASDEDAPLSALPVGLDLADIPEPEPQPRGGRR